MAVNQKLRESYDYKITDAAELPGIGKVVCRKFVKLMTVCSICFIAIALITFFAGSRLGAGIIFGGMLVLDTILAISISNVKRTYQRAMQNQDGTEGTRVRIYDDFLVLESYNGVGVTNLITVKNSDLTYLGRNEKFHVIQVSLYYLAIPDEILNFNSVIKDLAALKGKKLPKSPDAPERFTEPKVLSDEAPSSGEAYSEEAKGENQEAREEFASETNGEQSYQQNEQQNEQQNTYGASGYSGNGNDSGYLYEKVMRRFEMTPTLKLFSVLCFVFSIISIPISVVANFIINSQVLLIVAELFLLAFPIVSIVVGVIVIRRGGAGLKNIIVGAIAVVVIFNMMTPLSQYASLGDAIEEIEEVEQMLGIDLPENESAYILSNIYTDESSIFSVSIDLSIAEYRGFLAKAKNDKRFVIGSYPTAYVGLMPKSENYNDGSIGLLYNATEDSYNALPSHDGTYLMYFIYVYKYQDGTAYMTIDKYNVEYITTFGTPDI